MRPAEVSYARSGNVAVAYQVIGEGAPDFVFVRGIVGDLLSTWDQPLLVRHCNGRKSAYRLWRENVNEIPLERMYRSVSWWSRARVNVASGPAAMIER